MWSRSWTVANQCQVFVVSVLKCLCKLACNLAILRLSNVDAIFSLFKHSVWCCPSCVSTADQEQEISSPSNHVLCCTQLFSTLDTCSSAAQQAQEPAAQLFAHYPLIRDASLLKLGLSQPSNIMDMSAVTTCWHASDGGTKSSTAASEPLTLQIIRSRYLPTPHQHSLTGRGADSHNPG